MLLLIITNFDKINEINKFLTEEKMMRFILKHSNTNKKQDKIYNDI